MAVKANLTKTTNITAPVRAIDFVTSFRRSFEALREVYGFSRPIRKAPGTELYISNASVTLQSGAVAEGDEIPYSLAGVASTGVGPITINKYAKAVSLEAIDKFGYDVAVAKTDDEFRDQLLGIILSNWYTFAATGTLTSTKATWQAAVADSIGQVRNKFQTMNREAGDVIVMVNTLDAYGYLGTANITIQTTFGVTYVENFMGARVMVLTDKVAAGTVIATPMNNIMMYYIDPSESDYARAGLEFVTDEEVGLIGFHTEGQYSHMVSESYAIMGIKMLAEYIDGIAVVTVGSSTQSSSDQGSGTGA